jgi:hypothetical protein
MQDNCEELELTVPNVENQEPLVVKSKRGRKSKKELMELELLNLANGGTKISTTTQLKKNKKKEKEEKEGKEGKEEKEKGENNIKEGKEGKEGKELAGDLDIQHDVNNEENNEVEVEVEVELDVEAEAEPKVFKKRGRKPKGGKIIQPTVADELHPDENQNIILHLKCSMNDLDNIKDNENEGLDAYNTHIYDEFVYNYQKMNEQKFTPTYINSKNNEFDTDYDADADDSEYNCRDRDNNNNIKEIWKKLKQLECNLHINNISKKSCCFWDTCDFDTPPIYIPKYFINNSYHVYGCFCSPECAVAYLNNEQIDRSSKSERYQLLHDIYSKIYEYNNPIKEASDPRYLLDKFFGNLSIKEYRNLLKYGTSYHVIDKPLTKVYPEIHENNEDYILNNKTIPLNRRLQGKSLSKKQNKTSILSENFGIG